MSAPLRFTTDPRRQQDTLRRQINACAPRFLVREYLQNALEAGAHEIHFFADKHGRLVIRDNGHGMGEEELRHFANDIWHSSGKSQGLNENLGIGARIAGLRTSPKGFLVETCRGKGTVYATYILEKNGIFCRWDNEWSERNYISDDGVADLSADYPTTERQQRWTKITFYGDKTRRKTARQPWIGASNNWACKEIFHRFARLRNKYGEEPQVFLATGTGVAKETRTSMRAVIAILDFLKNSKQHVKHYTPRDHIDAGHVITIHYAHVTQERFRCGAYGHGYAFGGVVYQNEIYDAPRTAAAWHKQAQSHINPGITGQVLIFVELPEQYPVLINENRQHLSWSTEEPGFLDDHYIHGGTGAIVHLEHFVDAIETCKPEWLRELEKEGMSRKLEQYKKQQEKELRDWLRSLNLKRDAPVKDKKGNITGQIKPGEGGGSHGPRPPHPNPRPPVNPDSDIQDTKASWGKIIENLPRVRWMIDSEATVPIETEWAEQTGVVLTMDYNRLFPWARELLAKGKEQKDIQGIITIEIINRATYEFGHAAKTIFDSKSTDKKRMLREAYEGKSALRFLYQLPVIEKAVYKFFGVKK